MSTTEKITEYVTTATEPFTAKEIAASKGVAVAQVRPILAALVEQGKVKLVCQRRTNMRGRPSNAFVTVK